MTKLRAFALALFSALMVATSLSTTPAQAAPAPDESYLFVIDGAHIKIVQKKSNPKFGYVKIDQPSVIRFSDRPYRHELDTTIPALLRAFGWDKMTDALAGPIPNGSVSITGMRSQIVELDRARYSKGKVVFTVRAVKGTIKSGQGHGFFFIDNAAATPEIIIP